MNPAAVVVVLIATTSIAKAETSLRFRWKVGEQHSMTVSHTTKIEETAPLVPKGQPETTSRVTKLSLTKRWDVTEIDGAGVATMTLTITAMRQEIVRPLITKEGKLASDTIVMDSSTPEGAKEMAAFLNVPILTAKIDARGAVLEAKSANGDSAANRLQAELPFRIWLPDKAVEVNASWERSFAVKLDPPLGTGESHAAKQTYRLRALQNDIAIVGVTTQFDKLPEAAVDQQPLLPWLWEGDVFLNVQTGRYAGAKLKSRKTIPNHQGEGTKFVFESEYVEAPVGK